MLRRVLAVVALAVTFLLVAPMTAAFADNCFNASRPGPDSFSGPLVKGGWVWLPSVGVPNPAWGKEVPENFQNGKSDWLLGGTPYCDAGGALNPDGTPRQDTHGIQSGCGAFG